MCRSNVAIAVSLALAAGISSAYADSPVMEEIVVTAQKRAQALNDVGIAVTAYTGDDLREQGFREPIDMAKGTPGLVTVVATGVPVFAIRGVGLDDFNANNTSGVGTYVDEVYISSSAMLDFQLFDIDRVEVLKGPQGTLYGRNTTGGAINFISRRPSHEFEAYTELGYGRWGRLEIVGAAGGPVSDNVRWRLAGKYINQDDGWQDDVSNGSEAGKPEKWGLRGLLEWDITERADLLLNIHGGSDESVNWQWHADDTFGLNPVTEALFGTSTSSPSVADRVAGGSGFTSVGGPLEPERNDDSAGAAATLNVDLGFATLTSITGYDEYDRENFDLVDGSPSVFNDQIYRSSIDQFSQELRLTSASDGNFTWIAGVSYYSDKVDTQDSVLITNAIDLLYLSFDIPFEFTPTGLGAASSVTANYVQKTKAYGFFGHTEWLLSDQWRLIAGLRYSNEKREFTGTSIDNEGFVAGVPGPVALAALDDSKTRDHFDGKIGVDYTPTEDSLIYASISTGFKSGVYYGSSAGSQDVWGYVDPETLIAYELGFKSTLAEGKVRFNGAAFFYDYEDKQFLAAIDTPLGPAASLGNVPKAEISGAELEVWWKPAAGLDLKAGLAYLDTKVTEPPTSVRGIPFVGSLSDGDELSFSPKLSYNLLARYERDLTDKLSAAIQADYSHKDSMISILGDPVADTDDVNTVGARASIGASDGRWELALWGRNLTDDDAVTYAYTNFLGDRSYSLQEPRSYGVTVFYNF